MGTKAVFVRELSDQTLQLRYMDLDGHFEYAWPLIRTALDEGRLDEFFSDSEIEDSWASWAAPEGTDFECVFYVRGSDVFYVIDYWYMLPIPSKLELVGGPINDHSVQRQFDKSPIRHFIPV